MKRYRENTANICASPQNYKLKQIQNYAQFSNMKRKRALFVIITQKGNEFSKHRHIHTQTSINVSEIFINYLLLL